MKHEVAEQIKLNAKALHLLYSYCQTKACLPTKAGMANQKNVLNILILQWLLILLNFTVKIISKKVFIFNLEKQ